MKIKKGVHQLSLVELLTERDNIQSSQSPPTPTPREAFHGANTKRKAFQVPFKQAFQSILSDEILPVKSIYQLEEIDSEIENRSPTEDELKEADRVKNVIQKIRRNRANEGLSFFMKVLILIIPEIVLSRKKDSGPSLGTWEDEELFLKQAGYQRQVKQRSRLALIGLGIRILVIIFILARHHIMETYF